MRYILVSLLSSFATFKYAALPDFMSREDSKKILEISKQIVAHPELSADLMFDHLEDIVSSPKLLTESDVEELGLQIPSEDLEQINAEFFEGMKRVVEEKLPQVQKILREEKNGSLQSQDLEELNL